MTVDLDVCRTSSQCIPGMVKSASIGHDIKALTIRHRRDKNSNTGANHCVRRPDHSELPADVLCCARLIVAKVIDDNTLHISGERCMLRWAIGDLNKECLFSE